MSQILTTRSCQRCIHYHVPPQPPSLVSAPQCVRFIITDSVTNRSYYMEAVAARASSATFCGQEGRFFVPYFPPENNDKRQF